MGVFQAGGCGPVAVRGAVVCDPEHAPGRGVRLGAHHLLHQGGERPDAGGGLAPARDLSAVDVVGGQAGQGAAAGILAVGTQSPPGPWRERQVDARACLGAWLLAGAEHDSSSPGGSPSHSRW